uniref:Nucleolar complex protein 2 homolog n=1 Tax=Plectus sambesii TaxID=2011161 RepID=A0A914WXR4_9BILA
MPKPKPKPKPMAMAIDDVDGDQQSSAVEHKNALARLEKADPEFFKFLKEQDADLLDFDESDDDAEEREEDEDEEVEEEDDDDDSGAEEPAKKVRQLKIKTDRDGRKVLDENVLTSLETALDEERPSPSAVRRAVVGFTACVARVGAEIDPPAFVIKDEQVFDGLVRLCFSRLGEALYAILEPIKQERSVDVTKMDDGEEEAVKSGPLSRFRRWKKYSAVVKQYLSDLLSFLGEVQEAEVISATIRAINKMVDLYVIFAKLSRQLVKQLVRVWSRKQEECRVVAFIALSKLIRVQPDMFSFIIKSCYLGFVSNARLVTEETWPLLALMQQSFADLCMIDPVVAYQYAFVYIRQTGIHLRNAMIAKKKELVQAVYNWQFVQCLYLWTRVITTAVKSVDGGCESIQELAYPLVQVIVGCANLLPTVKYYPLRFHCVRALIRMQVGCGIYTPAIPLLTH